jgi:hypothetical protein
MFAKKNMETKSVPFNKMAMSFGAMLGIVLTGIILLTYVFDMTTVKFFAWLQYLIIAGGIVLAQIKLRDNTLGGYMSYGRALGFGTLTMFYAAIITGFFTYILYAFIEPGLVDKILDISEQKLFEQGLSDEEIDMALTFTRKLTSPTFIAFSGVLGTTFAGFIFSLITSIFTKKKDDSFESNFQ